MSKRGVITDYAAEELYAGDLVAYATRQGNRVRLADAIVHKVVAKPFGGRLVPMLLVKPTGVESGFTARRNMRKVWIGAEHARLIKPGAEHIEADSNVRW
jgi:hypothetical protein